VKTEIY